MYERAHIQGARRTGELGLSAISVEERPGTAARRAWRHGRIKLACVELVSLNWWWWRRPRRGEWIADTLPHRSPRLPAPRVLQVQGDEEGAKVDFMEFGQSWA
jgi:hypothetical protein